MKKRRAFCLRNARLLVLAIVVLCSVHGFACAQSGWDKTVQIQRASLDSLTRAITSRCTTDSARAYEIYKWIAQNISYDFATLTGKEDPYKKIKQVYTGYKLTPRRTRSCTMTRWHIWYCKGVRVFAMDTPDFSPPFAIEIALKLHW